jgi:cyclophilin family peptidyl-prolyl cis-trans isomerase/HEAT repeat protein
VLSVLALSAALLPAAQAQSWSAAEAIFRRRLQDGATAYSDAEAAALARYASDPDPEARWRAVYAGSRWAEPRLASVFAKAASDRDSRVRLFAVRSLARLGTAPAPARLSDRDVYVRAEAVAAFAAAKAFERLPVTLFDDPSAHVRAAMADAAGASGDLNRFAGPLERLTAGPGTLAPGRALVALTRLRGEAARPVLDRARADSCWWLRARAYEAAALLPHPDEVLAEGLKDRDPRVAAQALETLAASTSPLAVPALAAALSDPFSPLEVRGTAADAAVERKDPALVAALLKALPAAVGPGAGELRGSLRKALTASAPPASPWSEPVAKALAGFPQFLDAPRVFKPLLGPAWAVFETERGGFVISLSTKAANHAAAFAESVAAGLYDGTEWHRVVTGFVVQGGDPRGSGWGDAGWRLADEAGEPSFARGTVGMPKAGPDTGGCQLFVSLVPTPHLDGRYTAFGRVVEGLDVLDRLEPSDRILKATLRAR